MKKFNKSAILNMLAVSKITLILLLCVLWTTPASAHVSPAGCTGSGLGISIFTSNAQVSIGDVVSYSIVVYNGLPGVPIVCDATGITASVTTPDGVNHPVTLTRTSLSDGEFDSYIDVVTYTAAASDITVDGTLVATASDSGVIHQNIVNSAGGGNQGLNVYVLNTLHVIKQVINDSGGTATASAFNLHVKLSGTDVAGSPALGTSSPGTLYSVIADTYDVSEDIVAGYSATFSGDCDASGSVTLAGGQNKTCTVTNNDIAPASLRVVKTVTNDDGKTKVVADFPLFVDGAPVVSGAINVFPAGAHTVTETIDIDYTQTFSGDCDLLGNITLLPGDSKVCTINNNDIPPLAASINVVKVVVNDNGGTKTIPDFPLFVSEMPSMVRAQNSFFANTAFAQGGATLVISGVTNIFPAGDYSVTETSDSNYIQSFSGDCDVNGVINLIPGDHKFCIVTNDDIPAAVVPTPPGGGGGGTPEPPLINVVKVPSPLALPNGPGPVTYTYTLYNIGRVAVTDITMIGDTCSPVVLVSGDTDNDNRLDVNEIWIYTCTTILPRTHTNTITATGWANGISAVDIASATVVVGVPGLPDTGLIPPLIHVTKVPSPLLLPTPGGMVTYTNIVTNPGVVPLSNVRLTDDKCGPVSYVSGDLNGDSMLDTNEAWAYTCQTNLIRTTTNTVIAEGDANGFTARDFAIVTVVVAIPGLPNTGFPPMSTTTLILAGILAIVLISLILFLRKKTLPHNKA